MTLAQRTAWRTHRFRAASTKRNGTLFCYSSGALIITHWTRLEPNQASQGPRPQS